MIVCEWCDHTFENKKILNKHIISASYCLKLQGKTNENFKCTRCNKFFASQYSVTRHKNSCNKKEKKKTKKSNTQF